ncbi:MAG TPA: helix-hairpin-helix domain-containing protein [Polyangiales bacterium]|nr:helix-hairpin-helix domain-containing protein [Polyangiales bacterium]
MELPVHNAKGVALNTASEDELSEKIGLGPERASRIMSGRPFRSWDDMKRIEGLTDAIVDQLQSGGAELGDPDAVTVDPREEDRMLEPEERDGEIRGRRL